MRMKVSEANIFNLQLIKLMIIIKLNLFTYLVNAEMNLISF